MSRKLKNLYIGALIYFIITYGFIIAPPFVNLINKVHPYILVFPCFQFFILLSAVLMSCGLMVWYLLEVKIEDEEAKEGEVNA